MKVRLIFSGIFLLISWMSFAQEGYKIVGNIPGLPDGPLYLVTPTTEGMKTLGTVDVKGGIFIFEGNVERGCVALLKTTDQQITIPVMLENTEIRLDANEGGLVITGGEAQQLYNQYLQLMQSIATGQASFQKEFQVAMQVKDQNRMEILRKQCDKYVEEGQQRELAWIKEHSKYFVAAYIVASAIDQLDYESLKVRYDLLDFSAKATFYGQLVMLALSRQKAVAVGEIAPNFTVKRWEGDTISLHGIKGKVKLLHFWSSGNNVCRENNVELLKLYNKYHSKGFEIFSVSLDENESEWKKAIGEDGMVWKHGSDLKGATGSEVVRLYFVKNIPCTFLLDEENRIVGKNLTPDALKKEITEKLKKK